MSALGWLIALGILLGAALLVLAVGRAAGTLRQTIAALSLQVVLSMAFLFAWGMQDDALTYFNAASRLAEGWASGASPDYFMERGKRTTEFMAGVIFYLAGPYPALYLVFAASLTAYIPTLTAAATNYFGFPESTSTASWLSVVAPAVLMWAPWFTREALSFVLIGCATVAFGLIYQRRWGIPTLALWALTAWAMSVTRQQLLLVLAAGTIAALVLSKDRSHSTSTSRAQRLGRVATAGLLGSGAVFLIAHVLSATRTAQVLDAGSRAGIQNELASGGNLGIKYGPADLPAGNEADGVLYAPSDSPMGVGVEWVQRLVNSTVGPLPWEWNSTSMLVAGLDGMLMFAVWAVLILGFAWKKATRRMIAISILAAVPLIAGEALMHANYGLSMRVRAHYFILFLPSLAVLINFALDFVRRRSGISGSAARSSPCDNSKT